MFSMSQRRTGWSRWFRVLVDLEEESGLKRQVEPGAGP